MEATREERLQMRQRGAGTRKIQQVDFGFSFGGPAIGPSDPAPKPLAPEPAEVPQIQSAPTAATPPSSKVASQSNSQEEQKSQRTPGSARNNIPQRPSTFDIPSDDRPTEQLSNKRRKPNPPTERTNTPSRRKSQRSLNGDSTSTQNGDTVAAQAQPGTQPQPPSPEPQSSEQTQQDSAPEINGAGPPAVSDQAQPPARGPRPDTSPAPASGAEVPDRAQPSNESIEEPPQNVEQPAHIESAQTRARKSRSPTQPNKSAKAGKGRSEKKASPKAASPTSTRGDTKAKGSRKRGPQSDTPEAEQEPAAKVGTGKGEDASASTAEQPEKAQRSSRATKKSRTVEEVAPDAEAPSENAQSTAPKAKRPRGRASLEKTADKEVENRQATPTEPATQAAAESSEPSKRRSRKPAKKAEAQADPEVENQDQRESPAESTQAASKPPKANKRQNRRTKKAQAQAQAQPEPDPEPEQEPEPELEQPEEPEPAVSSGPSKSRRGKAGKKTQRAAEASTTTTEGQPEHADEESSQPTGRKTRAPRGETVPVTIHRLANVSALGAEDASVGPDEEGDNSGDELSARQMTKLPNRGGVNPADVLGQICRETLEKTLATLKNGIANEANQNKRAEWTRKRKAVEAFGSELDGRLLDLSEMLDSNFVLGVQLKKAKRDMMDLRGHLYRVRKERESVALQMDAVRAKHMEEESAKSARNTINNSFHSLELALDRNQNRGTSDAAPADIEFLLRTVANDVSSRAPGAQGGLLNQIRAFNTQLETTARRLERQ